MVMSDFTPEVEIRLFRACAIKICNITLIYGRTGEMFRVLTIWVEEHDDNVRF